MPPIAQYPSSLALTVLPPLLFFICCPGFEAWRGQNTHVTRGRLACHSFARPPGGVTVHHCSSRLDNCYQALAGFLFLPHRLLSATAQWSWITWAPSVPFPTWKSLSWLLQQQQCCVRLLLHTSAMPVWVLAFLSLLSSFLRLHHSAVLLPTPSCCWTVPLTSHHPYLSSPPPM